MDINKEKSILTLSGSKIAMMTGIKIKVMMAPKEEYLKMYTTIDHRKIEQAATAGEYTRITPKAVATPFPPLNLRDIGKIWPRITATPDRAIQGPSRRFFAKMMVNVPFNKSPRSVMRAGTFPIVLNTFVAPIFPLPLFWISIPLYLEIRTPKGIEPIRYERIMIINPLIIKPTRTPLTLPLSLLGGGGRNLPPEGNKISYAREKRKDHSYP